MRAEVESSISRSSTPRELPRQVDELDVIERAEALDAFDRESGLDGAAQPAAAEYLAADAVDQSGDSVRGDAEMPLPGSVSLGFLTRYYGRSTLDHFDHDVHEIARRQVA